MLGLKSEAPELADELEEQWRKSAHMAGVYQLGDPRAKPQFQFQYVARV